MRFLVPLLFLLFTCVGSIYGQPKAEDNDKESFNQYLSGTFAEYYPVQLLQRMYQHMSAYARDSVKDRYVLSDFGNSEGNYVAADHSAEGPQMDYTPTRMIGKEQGFAATDRRYDDRAFPDSLRSAFKYCFKQLRSAYPQKKKLEKNTLTCLTSFGKEASNMPTFFADVKKNYGGDMARYVKDLFRESILLDARQYQRFLRHPSAAKLQHDKGVQFVMGIALYRLWLSSQPSLESAEKPCMNENGMADGK